ncbi:MAG: DUF4236 domain-containing protein [Flavobacteriales bacterium]|nr:DUF4236 domain-containing protein [Flavobacteriales bacterium]
MRFRRRTKLFPGVYLNFSKSGISTTIGPPGASFNINRKGTFLNTSIPGTGLYDRQRVGVSHKEQPRTAEPTASIVAEDHGAIQSEPVEGTTSQGLTQLKETILECYEERQALSKELSQAQTSLFRARILHISACVFLIGFLVKWFRENVRERREVTEGLKQEIEACVVPIDMDMDHQLEEAFGQLRLAFRDLASCEAIWDITASVDVDRSATRSAASTTISRRPVKFKEASIDVIQYPLGVMHLANANGGDLYIYPAFVALVSSRSKFGLIDLKDLRFAYHTQRFVESEKVPSDAIVYEHTCAKVNKNGSPDKRFKGNYQIPICTYGVMRFSSASGLNEAYQLSSERKSEAFANALSAYLRLV